MNKTNTTGPGTIFGRSKSLLAIASLLCLMLIGGACNAEPPGGGTGATYKNGRCAGTEGVTIVVDFATFRDEVVVRCALGAQSSGFSVLDNAGFSHDPGQFPGTVCQLDGLPTQGHPFCWTTGGYWSYWKAPSAGAPWAFSEWGAGTGPSPALGSVEGWRFAPFAEGGAQPPRVGTSGPIVP